MGKLIVTIDNKQKESKIQIVRELVSFGGICKSNNNNSKK